MSSIRQNKRSLKNSIAMIICYFGELPWFFEYFAHSCAYNPSIDFYIITDCKSYEQKVPPNIHFIYSNLDTINEHASQQLGFQTNIRQDCSLL